MDRGLRASRVQRGRPVSVRLKRRVGEDGGRDNLQEGGEIDFKGERNLVGEDEG